MYSVKKQSYMYICGVAVRLIHFTPVYIHQRRVEVRFNMSHDIANEGVTHNSTISISFHIKSLTARLKLMRRLSGLVYPLIPLFGICWELSF